MPRYFFHLHDGVDKLDRDGLMLRDIHAARAQALMLAGEVIKDAGLRAELGEDWRLEVTDATGLTLFLMDFVVVEAPAAGIGRARDGWELS